jgi:hypothetical protein
MSINEHRGDHVERSQKSLNSSENRRREITSLNHIIWEVSRWLSCCVREVKEMDLKSIGFYPRRFKSCRQRYFFGFCLRCWWNFMVEVEGFVGKLQPPYAKFQLWAWSTGLILPSALLFWTAEIFLVEEFFDFIKNRWIEEGNEMKREMRRCCRGEPNGKWNVVEMKQRGMQKKSEKIENESLKNEPSSKLKFPHETFNFSHEIPPTSQAKTKKVTLPAGFEPTRVEPNGFQVHLLNLSDTAAPIWCFQSWLVHILLLCVAPLREFWRQTFSLLYGFRLYSSTIAKYFLLLCSSKTTDEANSTIIVRSKNPSMLIDSSIKILKCSK